MKRLFNASRTVCFESHSSFIMQNWAPEIPITINQPSKNEDGNVSFFATNKTGKISGVCGSG